MALSRFVTRRLNDTCVRKTFTGTNAYGDATYSTTPATFQCRNEEKLHMVVGSNGKDVLARGFLVVGPTTGGTNPTVEPQDLITLKNRLSPNCNKLPNQSYSCTQYFKCAMILHLNEDAIATQKW